MITSSVAAIIHAVSPLLTVGATTSSAKAASEVSASTPPTASAVESFFMAGNPLVRVGVKGLEQQACQRTEQGLSVRGRYSRAEAAERARPSASRAMRFARVRRFPANSRTARSRPYIGIGTFRAAVHEFRARVHRNGA